ncbi:GNAT family N-acetyltransferase [Methylacidimicrobium sp. B4]|uniref:GNAT family N-acetyltransferase n=1 Tax=Methylacidimicrobium sp. B4 TaxID=2796139 RepID=UPI001A8D5E2F|nr:GNAT family protein [Methylacidimicrobium sp. B4]QSR84940.1 GNAT family N-acetyltransferase [Methylacidimicrobium sp. B4]
MRLECGLCTVRDWRLDDETALIAAANNRKVWRNLTHRFPHPYTQNHAREWLASLAATPEPTHWAIEVEGVAAGGIGVDRGEGVFAKSGHLGYWLGEPYWGRGIMTAAVRAVSEYALDHFGLVRLQSYVFAWNPASMRVLQKAGFVREGILRKSVYKDGECIDEALYALVR